MRAAQLNSEGKFAVIGPCWTSACCVSPTRWPST